MAANLGFRALPGAALRRAGEAIGTESGLQDALQAGLGDRRACYPPVTTRLGTLTST